MNNNQGLSHNRLPQADSTRPESAGNDPTSADLSLYVRQCARAQSLSLSEVARRAGLSRQSLYNICHIRASPNLGTIIHLADALGVHPLQLLKVYLASLERHVELDAAE